MFARICRLTIPALIVLAGLLAYRIGITANTEPAPTTARSAPWSIEPQHDMPVMVTDDELYRILDRLKPPKKVNTNNFVHALRLWGREAEFDDPEVFSGAQLWSYFMDDDVFQQIAGSHVPPLFERQGNRVLVRGYDDDYQNFTTSSYHVDDLLATMAETGTPLDTPMKVRNGTATVRDLLESAMMRFHLSRHESEWSLISYGRYLFPVEEWNNQYGESIDLDSMLDVIIDPPLTNGPCNGAHRLEALVVLYRANEQAQALEPRVRHRMLKHMQRVSQLLVLAQNDDGSWGRTWPAGPEARNVEASLAERILVTGHQLEWLAFAPRELHPPRDTLVRASRWLVNAMLEIDDATLQKRFGPLSHAARALSLWRGQHPYEAWQKGHLAQLADNASDEQNETVEGGETNAK